MFAGWQKRAKRLMTTAALASGLEDKGLDVSAGAGGLSVFVIKFAMALIEVLIGEPEGERASGAGLVSRRCVRGGVYH